MIGVDWGTSSLRAFRFAPDGAILDRRHAATGIMHVEGGAFGPVLRSLVGDWLGGGETSLLLAGMIGSRQGWQEAPYLACPAGATELAAAIVPLDFEDFRAAIVPGLSAFDEFGTPEVMRGEETQLAGILDEADRGPVCLPGTHSKWARIADGRIAGFSTHMTGEAFAALRGHTILGRLMEGGEHDPAAFAAGVARSADSGGLLHHLFGARALVLTERMPGTGAASYLSGLLIGHEIRAALGEPASGGSVRLVGDPALCRLYAEALAECGASSTIESPDAAALGLARIGRLAGWV